MTQTAEELFNEGMERYKQGEQPSTLIPLFKQLCDRAPKSSPAWTCLSWLYLLDGKSEPAYKSAQRGVKLNPQDPQARVNLALAMLDGGKKGVREHIEIVQHLMMVSDELKQEVQESIADGFSRKPEWPSLKRLQDWVFG
jgi:predicted Zn-dependent protease